MYIYSNYTWQHIEGYYNTNILSFLAMSTKLICFLMIVAMAVVTYAAPDPDMKYWKLIKQSSPSLTVGGFCEMYCYGKPLCEALGCG